MYSERERACERRQEERESQPKSNLNVVCQRRQFILW